MKKLTYKGFTIYFNEVTNNYHYENQNNGEVLDANDARYIFDYIDQQTRPSNDYFDLVMSNLGWNNGALEDEE